jgi:phosphatidylglycerol:prolipoprotein diacylglycerol transferase
MTQATIQELYDLKESIASELFDGLTFMGGLVFGVITFVLFGVFAKDKEIKRDFFPTAQIAAPCIALAHCFGRIGCFLAGCCYGKESTIGFAAKENQFIPDVVGVTRFPVQLLESFLNIMLFLALFYVLKKGYAKERLIFIYLSAYSVIRFSLEFLRGDVVRVIWLGVSTSQWVSMILFALSAFMLIMKKLKKKSNDMIRSSV